MAAIDPDLDWYLDHILGPAPEPNLGPARRWQAAWRATADGLDATDLNDLALTQGFVVTIAQARALGVSRAQTRRELYRSVWSSPRFGVICVLPAGDNAEQPCGLRPEIAAAAQALMTPSSTISHDCAGLAHGLPVLRRVTRPVVTTRLSNTGGDPLGRANQARLFPDDVDTWFGVGITIAARTVLDLARTTGARGGLAAADAALREGLATRDELWAQAARATRWPGVRTARKIIELASPLAESPLESITRLAIHDGGLPVPELQAWLDTSRGAYRVDGLWRAQRLVLECDGMLKYSSIADIHAEKRRQHALERAGYRVVRVTWDDIARHEQATVAHLRRALDAR